MNLSSAMRRAELLTDSPILHLSVVRFQSIVVYHQFFCPRMPPYFDYDVRQCLYHLIGTVPSRTELLCPILFNSRSKEPHQIALLVIVFIFFQVTVLLLPVSSFQHLCPCNLMDFQDCLFKFSHILMWFLSRLHWARGYPIDQVSREVKFPAICHHGRRYLIYLVCTWPVSQKCHWDMFIQVFPTLSNILAYNIH